MKRNLMKFAEKLSAVCMLAIGVVAAFSLGSCDKEPKEEPVTVVFPEAQTLNVQANTTETLNFTINADWILYSDSEWATFNGGELSASGGAGDVAVELEISDLGQTLEETSTAYLTLAAGSEEKVIYTINRAPEGIEFSITDTDGEEVTALTAGWEDYDYYTISANFVFAVSEENQPDWLETEDAVTNSESDPCTAGFKVVDDASYYKYTQSGKIVFANEAGTISFEYDITFPGMDADGIEIDGPGQYDWYVNKDGTVITYNGTETEPTFTISVLNDDYVIAVADYTWPDDWIYYVDPTYDDTETYDDEDAAWIHVSADDGKGTITLSFDETTAARKAYVLAFPRAFYDELNEAHNGHGLNWLPDDDEGDLDDEYLQYVIARVEQTTTSGSDSFLAYNSMSMADIDVETEAPDGYDFTSVTGQYSDAHVGYIPWEVGTNMMVTILPLLDGNDEANMWAMDPAAYDANGDSCYGQEYYKIEGGGNFYYAGNYEYCGVLVSLESTPEVDWFYLVFNNPDDSEGDTWVLFFYGQGEPAGTDEYGLVARVSTNTGVSYTDVEIGKTCPESLNTPSSRGANTPEDIIEEYGSPANVGYIPYQKGAQFNTSVTPLGSANYVEGYDSWDESLYLEARGWGSDYEGICEYEGGSYANGEEFGATIWCVDDLPDGIDFVFLAFKASDDDDDAIGILFFYKGEGSGSETDNVFDVTNGTTTASIDYDTEYDGPYDLTDILEKYKPAATGYLAYSLNTSYNVSFTNATASDEWIYDVKAYDYKGNDVFDAYEMECGSNWKTGTPYVNVYLEDDPGTLFYLVFNDGTNNYLFFFTTDQLPAEEPVEREFKLYQGQVTYEVKTEYDGPYDLTDIRDTYSPAAEGFYAYQIENNYKVTFVDATSDDTWITENYKAYAYDGSETISGVTFKTGSETDGTPYVQATVATEPGQLFYIVFNDGTDNYIFYFTTDLVPTDSKTEGEIVVYPSNSWGNNLDVYDAEDYEGKYELIDIANDLDAATAWYFPEYAATTAYWVTFADATASDSWITANYKVYSSSGTQIVPSGAQGNATADDGTQFRISTNTNNGIPYVQIMAGSADVMFYVVFNDGTDNYVIFFTPDDGSDSGEGEETTWSAVPTNVVTDWGESVWEDLYKEHGTEAWKPEGTPELYSDDMLGFYNGGGSGYKFNTTGSIYRVQLAGGGSTTKCNLQFKVTTNGTISVSAGSSSSGNERTLLIYAGDTEITNEADVFSEITTFTHSVTGISGETVISICSKDSGINIFEIKWVPDGVSGGDDNSGNDDTTYGFTAYCSNDSSVDTTIESEYYGDYSFAAQTIINKYEAWDVGYLNVVCDLNTYPQYVVTYLPLSESNTWIANNVKAYKLSNDDEISINDYTNQTYRIFSSESTYQNTYPGVTIQLWAEAESFYLVFTDGDGANRILFCLCEESDSGNGGGNGSGDGSGYDEDALFVVQNGDSYLEVKDGDTFTSGYPNVSNLATRLSSSYDTDDIAWAKFSGKVDLVIAPLPLDEGAEWVWNAELFDSEGDHAADYGEASITTNVYFDEKYPAVQVSTYGSPGLPIYVVFNDGKGNYSILILTDM